MFYVHLMGKIIQATVWFCKRATSICELSVNSLHLAGRWQVQAWVPAMMGLDWVSTLQTNILAANLFSVLFFLFFTAKYRNIEWPLHIDALCAWWKCFLLVIHSCDSFSLVFRGMFIFFLSENRDWRQRGLGKTDKWSAEIVQGCFYHMPKGWSYGTDMQAQI